MGHGYVIPKFIWNIEPTTIALTGITIGYTALNPKYIRICFGLFALLASLNYFYLLPKHQFNWFANFQTHYPDGSELVANTTSPYGMIPAPLSHFTAEDIGAVALMFITAYALAYSFYYLRKNLFKIMMYKMGSPYEIEDRWQTYKVKYYAKKFGGWKMILHWFFTLAQTIIPLLVFQTLSIAPVQDPNNGGSWKFPWNLIGGALFYTVFMFGGWALWYAWLWKRYIDKDKEMMLSINYEIADVDEVGNKTVKRKGKSWMYMVYTLWFWGLVVIFHLLHLIVYVVDLISPGDNAGLVYPTFIVAVFISFVQFGLSIFFYVINRSSSKPKRDMDTGEFVMTDKKYLPLTEES